MRNETAMLFCLVVGCTDAGSSVPPWTAPAPAPKVDSGGAELDSGAGDVRFARDVSPIFLAKCVPCHHQQGAISVYLDIPFDREHGIFDRENDFPTTAHRLLVVPGKPEESFIIDKVTAPTLDHATEGDVMPYIQPDVTPDEIALIRMWIEGGAKNDDFFRSRVAPIFGTALKLDERGGKCVWCHSSVSPFSPNLIDPFDKVRGVVNAAARFTAGTLIVPGDPDASVLFHKIGGAELAPEQGSHMPKKFARLTDTEVETLSSWIREGALNN